MIEVMNSRQVYSENGIKRQSIATCTPQQNWVYERKNRTLIKWLEEC
jgi:hypothetical protein